MKRKNPARLLQRGLSMVELLVALAIGSLLIVGAVFVYSQSRNTHALNETVARLQENARFILAVLEPDIQLAGNYGYSNIPSDIRFSDNTAVTDMEQADDKFTAAPTAAHDCGKNFSLDLQATVQGVEKGYLAGVATGCEAIGTPVADADTLVIRRASTDAQVASDKKLQILANRLSPTNQVLFSASAVPGGVTKAGFLEVRDIITNVYYVSQDSDGRAGFPSLRRKWLGMDGTTLKINDEEIMAGVEDFQVQFGIDMGADLDGDGVPDDTDANGVSDVVNGQATRYVNPGDAAVMKAGQVVSVRVWLRLRAEQGEVGFSDTKTYVYGSSSFTANDNIRRLIATRTFFLRNTRVLRN